MTTGSFKITTLGCKVNQYESEFIKDSLIRAGWEYVTKENRADLNIINTCIVTQRASYQSRQSIRKAIRENPSAKTIAVGCYGQVFPEELSEIEGLTLITGNREKACFPEILHSIIESPEPAVYSKSFTMDMEFDFLPVMEFLDRTRAFLKIQDGCESFCSYCIVPFARGPVRSLEPKKVIGMMKKLSDRGYLEIVLTGIHLGKYGTDLGINKGLNELLIGIREEKLPLRVRLSSIESNEVDRELIELMAAEEWLCSHLHVPLQSGDDRILNKMNRSYSTGEFSEVIGMIRHLIPEAAIGLDIMAGFPGEDDIAFQKGYSLVEDLPVSYLHVFPYSPRKGTPAADFTDQVKQDVIKSRALELRSLGESKRHAFNATFLGKELSVLTEGWESKENKIIKGLSDNYIKACFPSERLMKNKLVRVLVEKVENDYVIGKMVKG